MNILEIIEKTEEYLKSDISDHNRSLAIILLRELKKIENNSDYVVPANVIKSIIDSFDFSTDYWKKYFSKYWHDNLDKFKQPFE